MGVSILRNRLNLYNSLYFNKLQVFRSFGDMLIGSEIPPQADIIKFVITGGDPRVAGCGAVCQAKILASLGIMLYRYDVKVLNDMTPGKIVSNNVFVTIP